ncbi:MAG: hypothetical protein U0441_11335 [Polyangiaceae bacterium]
MTSATPWRTGLHSWRRPHLEDQLHARAEKLAEIWKRFIETGKAAAPPAGRFQFGQDLVTTFLLSWQVMTSMNDSQATAAFSSATRASIIERAIEVWIVWLACDPNLVTSSERDVDERFATRGKVGWSDGCELYVSAHWNAAGVLAVSYGIYGEGPERDAPAIILANVPSALTPLVEAVRKQEDYIAGAMWITDDARWLRQGERGLTDPLLHPLLGRGIPEVGGMDLDAAAATAAVAAALAKRILSGGGVIEEAEIETLTSATGADRDALLERLGKVGLRAS